jgi:hypothetical protein
MECPHCGKEIRVGAMLGGVRSEAKARAARLNGSKGGRKARKGLTVAEAERVLDEMMGVKT